MNKFEVSSNIHSSDRIWEGLVQMTITYILYFIYNKENLGKRK